MSHLEERLLRRLGGLRLLKWSLILGLAGSAPLLLYIVFGPSDGNPIGLGLLAVAAVVIGGFGAALGLIVSIVQYFTGKPR